MTFFSEEGRNQLEENRVVAKDCSRQLVAPSKILLSPPPMSKLSDVIRGIKHLKIDARGYRKGKALFF